MASKVGREVREPSTGWVGAATVPFGDIPQASAVRPVGDDLRCLLRAEGTVLLSPESYLRDLAQHEDPLGQAVRSGPKWADGSPGGRSVRDG